MFKRTRIITRFVREKKWKRKTNFFCLLPYQQIVFFFVLYEIHNRYIKGVRGLPLQAWLEEKARCHILPHRVSLNKISRYIVLLFDAKLNYLIIPGVYQRNMDSRRNEAPSDVNVPEFHTVQRWKVLIGSLLNIFTINTCIVSFFRTVPGEERSSNIVSPCRPFTDPLPKRR